MSGRLLSGLAIFQVAVVVRDLEAYATRQSELVGNGPWRLYEFGPHMMTRNEYHGQPATGTMLVALNDSRPQMEIIQPLTGASIYQDWLDQHGEGMHHVAAIVESVDAFVATASEHRIDVISRGEGFGVDNTGKYAYFDTHAALGMILEAVEPPTSLGEPLRRL